MLMRTPKKGIKLLFVEVVDRIADAKDQIKLLAKIIVCHVQEKIVAVKIGFGGFLHFCRDIGSRHVIALVFQDAGHDTGTGSQFQNGLELFFFDVFQPKRQSFFILKKLIIILCKHFIVAYISTVGRSFHNPSRL